VHPVHRTPLRGAPPLAVALASLVLGAASAVESGTAFPSTSQVTSKVDRTFACLTTRVVREGYPDSYVIQGIGVGMYPPNPTVVGGVGISDQNTGALVGVETGPQGGRSAGGIKVSTKQCTWRKGKRIPLLPAGLPAPPDRIERSYRCSTPRRILVRVRAVLSRPASWKSSKGVLSVLSPRVTEAQVAVRTSSGKPVAFADIGSARGELYVSRKSPRCVEG
jgi:hypothetical protein